MVILFICHWHVFTEYVCSVASFSSYVFSLKVNISLIKLPHQWLYRCFCFTFLHFICIWSFYFLCFVNQPNTVLERSWPNSVSLLCPPGCMGLRSTPWPTSCSCKPPPASRAPSRPSARMEMEVEDLLSKREDRRNWNQWGRGHLHAIKHIRCPLPSFWRLYYFGLD